MIKARKNKEHQIKSKKIKKTKKMMIWMTASKALTHPS